MLRRWEAVERNVNCGRTPRSATNSPKPWVSHPPDTSPIFIHNDAAGLVFDILREWLCGVATFGGKAQKTLVSRKCVVFWPRYPRPPKTTWPTSHFGIPLSVVKLGAKAPPQKNVLSHVSLSPATDGGARPWNRPPDRRPSPMGTKCARKRPNTDDVEVMSETIQQQIYK